MLISFYLLQSKYTKMHRQEIPSLSHNVLQLFYVSLWSGYLSDLHKKFQEASKDDINVEYQI